MVSGPSKPKVTPTPAPPTDQGPEIEAAKQNVYAKMMRQKGRAASDVTGGLALISPVQQQVKQLKARLA